MILATCQCHIISYTPSIWVSHSCTKSSYSLLFLFHCDWGNVHRWSWTAKFATRRLESLTEGGLRWVEGGGPLQPLIWPHPHNSTWFSAFCTNDTICASYTTRTAECSLCVTLVLYVALSLFCNCMWYIFACSSGSRAIGCLCPGRKSGETKKQRNEGSAATKLNFVRYFLSIFGTWFSAQKHNIQK